MADILYAWELGANLGHVGSFLPLARALRSRGHAVHWAVAAPATVYRVLDEAGFTWLQAPTLPERQWSASPLNYADILLRFGYADSNDLLGLTVAWRELLRLTGAQTLIVDHSPTALLAARTLDLPAVLHSSGFCMPPRRHPTPNMRPWQEQSLDRLQALDALALDNINAVLGHFGKPAIDAIWQLFEIEENALLGFPELDHYAHCRGEANYWGTLASSVSGIAPAWPGDTHGTPGTGPRIFAYLRRALPHAEAMLHALGRSGCPTVAAFPDIPEDLLARCRYPNLVISRAPLDAQRALQEADLAVTYGGHGLTAAFLLAGKPLLLAPAQLEQYLLARRVEAIGAGLCVAPDEPADVLAQRLERLRSEPGFAAAAQAFARKYAAFPQEKIIDNLVRSVEATLSQVVATPGENR